MLAKRGLDEVWFCRPANYSWLTGGDPVVDATSDVGVTAVGVGPDGVRVIAPNNECRRILDEELPALDEAGVDPDVTEYEWYEASLRESVAFHHRGSAAADVDIAGLNRFEPISMRAPMPAEERERYQDACEETTAAVEAVARSLTPETTEREAAADLSQALLERGFRAPVVLVGGGERSQRYRHYTPRDDRLGEFAHLTVVSERGGHDVAVTRTVTFDPPTWLRERHDAAGRVAATAIAATREAGVAEATAGDVFDAIVEAYDEVGFEGEWQAHHQGGAIGYATREWVATPDASETVEVPMPFAWNPTVQGAKCEDTVFVTEGDTKVLTETSDWPTTKYEAIGYDNTVTLHDPLPVE
ncbi:M24 family metallopeptidase [Halobacterium sp. KA-4]|uniref:M24 family metallopeptidase n=1 Tax=Halobacterium sp. KA-4 TaxID=2896367 RepID=UPI001E3380E9|nr:M24 family metallopeptidase [Halobacterium sp. KA-4]MCD2201186.1 M24 family metallopeptidase [Halobacterium sp. KA-4]